MKIIRVTLVRINLKSSKNNCKRSVLFMLRKGDIILAKCQLACKMQDVRFTAQVVASCSCQLLLEQVHCTFLRITGLTRYNFCNATAC
jgi:hypothetical protein